MCEKERDGYQSQFVYSGDYVNLEPEAAVLTSTYAVSMLPIN